MKSSIAVILAFNPNNSGMYSVDLAAKQFFDSLDVDYKMYVAQKLRRRGARFIERVNPNWTIAPVDHVGKLKCHYLKSIDQLKEHSHIVYWGDFLNNPDYGRDGYANRDHYMHLSASEEIARKKWLSLFALKGQDVNGKKVYSIGNNIQNPLDAEDPYNKQVIDCWEKHFDVILPRDVKSLEQVERLLGARSKPRLGQGLDCAFLLDHSGLNAENASSAPESPMFSYFFDRSKLPETRKIIRNIEKISGCVGHELDGWLTLDTKNAHRHFSKNVKQIMESQFVITDTYHVCVNAMSAGVPVVGMGRYSIKQDGSIGDYKKQVLFDMFDMGSYYLTLKEGSNDEFLRDVDQALERLVEERFRSFEESYRRVKGQVEEYRNELESLF
ncbi:polysaccharide pyruvyl transferase family protein [Marinimicrobium alkaliphilum]|uniref:polysaccharide pyruvyl transferase family protein n=1 Tax=Marinimicrobium alkaliphilum TaxID=2202654 RepID=UPI000DBA4E29|nr:polysaccharide pyruvyl transferase family protein [Marinimicrobium alkaliphilum]